MRFRFIAVERAYHTVTILCRCLRVTRTGFYAWQARLESRHARDDRRLKVLVRASFDESRQRYGSPRIHADLLEQQEQVSRKRIVRLMQEEGLVARQRKRSKQTTMSDHDQPVAVNDRHLTIKALEMALKRRGPGAGLLHHSDQGCTYASQDYQARLRAAGIVCSMSRRGNCWDNAVMESFFSTVKSELAGQLASYGDAKMELFDFIEVFYNQRRRHSTLGQISPAAFERRAMTQAA